MSQPTPRQTSILDRMSVLADALRVRLLLALGDQELTVSELCHVFQLPQSTVSRHLRLLGDAGWVVSRPDGPRRLYRLSPRDLDPSARRLWSLAREDVAGSDAARQDERRVRAVLDERRSRSRAFFDSEAGRWDRLRDELFGPRFHLSALLGLLDESWTVADLGCGSGTLSEALAPNVARVIAVDDSEAMLATARRRLERFDNVEVQRGELEALPLEDGSVDAATLVLVLHHLPDPARAVAEVARALRPGGRLLLVDMLPHDRREYRETMGHVWLGFSRETIEAMVRDAGLVPGPVHDLPADAAARGPALFTHVARAGRPEPARSDDRSTDSRDSTTTAATRTSPAEEVPR